ncbi:MAG: hypothetical protein KTR31_34045 [Myxococcales bacterium]|nr:hypothetical protein [Myxococcales bacterium]
MRSDTTFVDVPLHPDVGQPTPARIHQIIPESDRNNEFRHLPYHEQRWHAPLDYDHANSTGSSHVGEPRKGVQYQRQACLGPDDIYQHSVSLIWNMPSSQVSHTTLALAECPDVRLDLTQFTRFQPAADAEVCVNGTWQMLDTNSSPPSTLWSTTVSDCVSGPSESGRQSWALPVPPPSRIPHLQVRFDGSAHIDCSSAHPEVSSVGLLVHGMDGPRFSWEGCWPGWAP